MFMLIVKIKNKHVLKAVNKAFTSVKKFIVNFNAFKVYFFNICLSKLLFDRKIKYKLSHYKPTFIPI